MVTRLTEDQERALGARMADGDDQARASLWLAGIGIVDGIVRSLADRGRVPPTEIDDCLQIGYEAAGKAIDTWAHNKGRLSTWLTPHVHGAVIDYLRTHNKGGVATQHAVRAGKLPIVMVDIDEPITQAAEEATVTDAPGAHALPGGISRVETMTYQEVFGRSGALPLSEGHSPFEDPSDAILARQVRTAWGRLPKRMQPVIALYCGLDCEPHSVRELADALGVSKSEAGRRLEAALIRLRIIMGHR